MDQRQRSSGPVGGLLNGAGFVIGLATELHAHNKTRKLSNQRAEQDRTYDPLQREDKRLTDDENPPKYDKAVTWIRSTSSIPHNTGAVSIQMGDPMVLHPLPLPVILPQRRPNDKSRGFVRAYAPDLGSYKGIDQTTFLNFLKQFHKSSQASGWFQIINIAALGASLTPSLIAMAVATSIQVASGVASEAQSRYRTNSYLDKANQELFHPKNLHCMVMTFKPEASTNPVLRLETDKVSTAMEFSSFWSDSTFVSGSMGSTMFGGKFRTSDGVTESEFALPQAAHLVYFAKLPEPALSDVEDSGIQSERKQNSWKSTGKFLSDYKDRRAQAKFAATYGDASRLAVPGASDPARFASRFSDPNANPFSFMSDTGRQQNTSTTQVQYFSADAGDQKRVPSGGGSTNSGGLAGGMKKLIQQDLLYLFITEMPSKEELSQFAQS